MSGEDIWDILGPMLELSVRTYTRLKRAGINSIEKLTSMTPSELKKVRNLGRKSYEEILALLEQHGLHLKGEDEEVEEGLQKLPEEDDN